MSKLSAIRPVVTLEPFAFPFSSLSHPARYTDHGSHLRRPRRNAKPNSTTSPASSWGHRRLSASARELGVPRSPIHNRGYMKASVRPLPASIGAQSIVSFSVTVEASRYTPWAHSQFKTCSPTISAPAMLAAWKMPRARSSTKAQSSASMNRGCQPGPKARLLCRQLQIQPSIERRYSYSRCGSQAGKEALIPAILFSMPQREPMSTDAPRPDGQSSLPLDRAGRLRRDVVDHAVDSAHFIHKSGWRCASAPHTAAASSPRSCRPSECTDAPRRDDRSAGAHHASLSPAAARKALPDFRVQPAP